MLRRTLLLLMVASLLVGFGGMAEMERDPDLQGTLEIINWWTAGGEAEALAALFSVFSEWHPYVSVINATIAGGAGIAARAVLITRILGGVPPGTFQVHAGRGTFDPHVIPGHMEPITFLFEEEGWLNVFPQALLDMLRFEGEFWSVPVNIHRSNVLWYNKAIFAEHDLNSPTTFAEFFEAAAVLQAAGVVPLALGETWTVVHLFETVLLAVLGPDAYIGLWDGTTDWGAPEVTEALEVFDRILDYVNPDFPVLTWDEAAGLIVDGTAAMNIMGDWAHGYFMGRGWTPGVDYGWVPVPGSGGAFQALSDSFGLPKGAPDRHVAVAWLRMIGSRAGQDAFNPIKGSIPARVDADRTLYDAYLLSAMDDFARDMIVPSMVHGAAASPAWMHDISVAVGFFAADRDVAALQQALVAAAVDAL